MISFLKRVFIISIIVILGIGVFFVVKKTNIVNKEKVVEMEDLTAESVSLKEILGLSVQKRQIESFTYGNGNTRILFVGGMHGGYEWNSVLLANKFKDYLDINYKIIPANISISIIPSLNPDGVYKVIGKEGRFTTNDAPSLQESISGRFNANGVDLNRNFDCKWKAEGMWRGQKVSAGTSAFSEPESLNLKSYILKLKPALVVFWHSQANAVYASECQNGPLAKTIEAMNVYANASGYNPISVFDAYEVTGDAEGWLASIGIPAITVELKTHDKIDWDENLLGIKALFNLYKTKI